jgi:general stress protein 26
MDNIFLNACKNGQKGVVEAFVKKGGLNYNKRDQQGRSALFYACQRGARDIVKILIDNGAKGEHMETIKRKILKLVNKKIAFIGSVNGNNVPNIKAMLVAKHDGIKTFYFASNSSAMRTEQYKHNNNACIYFNGGPIYKGLMLEGTMEILNDEKSKKLIWQNGMKNIYKNGGMNDPDYCILKFTAKIGRYYYWFKTETFEIE